MNKPKALSPDPISAFHRPSLPPDVLTTYSPKLSRQSLNTIDCGLSRNETLATDKKRVTLNIMTKGRGKDISYLYETLMHNSLHSPVNEPRSYTLPINLKSVKALLESDSYRSELFLMNGTQPSSRKDAELLNEWLGEMNKKYLKNIENIVDSQMLVNQDMAETAEIVYSAALKEAIKQTASHCLPRALTMSKCLDRLMYIWKQYVYRNSKLIEDIDRKKNLELEKLKNSYQVSASKLSQKIAELELSVESSNKEKELLKYEVTMLKSMIFQSPQSEKPKKERVIQIKEKKKHFHKYVQTEEIREDCSEDSSSSEEIEDIQIVQPIDLKRRLSRQSTNVQERKKTEQMLYLSSKLQSMECEADFNIEDLYEYISKDYYDFYAWVDGFRTSAEYFKKKKEELKEINFNSNLKDLVLVPPPKTDQKKRSLKEPKLTARHKTSQVPPAQVTENFPVDDLIKKLLNQPRKKIEKHAKMMYNKLSRQVTKYLRICRNKGIENFESLGNVVYSELFQKYVIKHIVTKKFKELLGTAVKFSNDPKAQIFIRMLGEGSAIALSAFSAPQSRLVLRCYDFMINDKTGILKETSASECVYYPTIRAVECVKQNFEGTVPKAELVKMIKTVEEMSKSDPDFINQKGLIDIHAFVLATIQSFKRYFDEYFSGVKLAVRALSEEECVSVGEVHLLVRNISRKDEFKINIGITEGEVMDLKGFYELCVDRSWLRTEEVSSFFSVKRNFTAENVQETKLKISENLRKLGRIVTLSADEWESKLDDVIRWSKGKYYEKGLKLWSLLWSEFEFISSFTALDSKRTA